MGSKLLVVSIGSLLLIGFIDFFTAWYGKFLTRWMPNLKIRRLLGHLVWAILAIIFWNTLYHDHLPETFTPTYFFFVLFIYSLRGLIDSFIRARGQKAVDLKQTS
ncbi:hypothetical protein GWN42_19120 [candidate division KSB1 bacterium]|nr:hypothetical protein [candidate division KSB1 bacterium]